MVFNLLGNSKQNALQTLLGEYYDPRQAKMQWIGGTLQGLGMGLATGRPGAWAEGAIAGGTEGAQNYRQQALAQYGLAERKKEQEWQAKERARQEEEWAAQDAASKQISGLLGTIQDPQERAWAQMDPKGYLANKYGQRESKAPASIQEYEYARQQGYQGTLQDFEMERRRASATTVNMGGGTDKQIFDTTKERADAARVAGTGLTSLSQAEQALPGAITGAAADQRLGLQKVAALFGVGDTQAIVDTETFRSAIAPQVAAMLKATVGTTQVSNTDREFAEKAAAGSISLDGQSIQRLINIMQAMNSEVVRRYNTDLNQIYPEGQAFDRERAVLGVPNVPKRYANPIGPSAPSGVGVSSDPLGIRGGNN